jgi:L-lactate dehydrogenase complex protein LldF
MTATDPQPFKSRARLALADLQLQRALGNLRSGFVEKRRAAIGRLPEFDALRDNARDIKDHALAHLDLYLEAYEERVTEAGGTVHFAATAEAASAIIVELCMAHGAKTIAKGKSMVAEEIGLNRALMEAGFEVVETDLGEYVIQLRRETPSHIIAPAIHLNKQQIAADFRRAHESRPEDRDLSDAGKLLAEARSELRNRFLSADVGITGANFLVAETGTSIIVTNEGNGDLSQCLPKTHIVVASIEKIVPTLEDAGKLLRVLARSATGQEMSVYTTLSTGPRRSADLDGPQAYHVVLVDNGRSAMLGTPDRSMLRCIRCGACMNHCPVYGAIGGHAYGAVYPGPMGAVLTPALIGIDKAGDLPNASTFCGRCEDVCPVRIPLPKLMRHWREREFERHLPPAPTRAALALWAFFATRPMLYRGATRLLAGMLAALGRAKGRFGLLPFAGGWTDQRDLPPPQGGTFQARWRARNVG